jgi:acyl-CoA synthetase (AMP-forming)/AMP-acid ligase II
MIRFGRIGSISDAPSLRDAIAGAHTARAPRFFHDRAASVCFTDLEDGTSLGGRLSELAGRAVLLATSSQITSALALIELDGVARRIVILPPDARAEHLGAIIDIAGIDAVVVDDATPPHEALTLPLRVVCTPAVAPAGAAVPRLHTEWVLMTSGTTGVPKMVVHDLQSLTTALRAASPADGADVWGTFYDIRRYGGLQIYLRAVCGGASLVLSSADEPVADHLARLHAHRVTHLSGTPSQWRRVLMEPEHHDFAPSYVRLSGEIADQAVLDGLRAAFPQAVIGHAYASTEAGVVFDVNDGLAGFPARYLDSERDGVVMKIVDGSLRVRSDAVASGYVDGAALTDAAGFVDTGDIVELRGERFYFAGRKGGIINVGGLKVHPEEIEAVINRHPSVRMSLVRGRGNPVTGSIVVADVVLKNEAEGTASRPAQVALKDDIIKLCRDELPRHKVPAAISFVPALNVAATGKLVRRQG